MRERERRGPGLCRVTNITVILFQILDALPGVFAIIFLLASGQIVRKNGHDLIHHTLNELEKAINVPH